MCRCRGEGTNPLASLFVSAPYPYSFWRGAGVAFERFFLSLGYAGLKKQRQESVAFPNYPLTTVITTVPNPHQHIHAIMASPPTHVHASWHVEHATSLPEIWARIAVFSGPVGAWRLTGVCRAAREGAKEHLRSLPGLVVVYSEGVTATRTVSEVWRLELASLQWESMPALVTAHVAHGCCAVRGSVAVFAGRVLVGNEVTTTASVEVLVPLREGGAFVSLPPLSYGGIYGAAAITVEESDSTAGQVLLLGGSDSSHQSQNSAHAMGAPCAEVCFQMSEQLPK